MTEPMSDARLAMLIRNHEEEVRRFNDGWTESALSRTVLLEEKGDLLAEVQQLRAELAEWEQKFVREREIHKILKQERDAAQAHLAIYEPEEKDETPVCRHCGIPWGGCACSNSPYTKPPVCEWRYLAAQKIMGGE